MVTGPNNPLGLAPFARTAGPPRTSKTCPTMKSRNSREGRYCGYTTSPSGEDRRHVRSQIGCLVSAEAAARAMVARLTSEAEEYYQVALAARIMDEDRHVLRELARR